MDMMDAFLIIVLSFIMTSIMILFISFITRIEKPRDEDLEKCRDELSRVRSEINEREESIRRYYEHLLRDSAIRNSMMVGLWNAFKNGELSRCYGDGGKVRLLADGTVICEKGERSYAVKGEGQ